jgi:hypothetical protein
MKREEYLLMRQKWRDDYALLSAEIRSHKAGQRTTIGTEQSIHQSACHFGRIRARQMMEQRAELKAEAQRSYAESRSERAMEELAEQAQELGMGY